MSALHQYPVIPDAKLKNFASVRRGEVGRLTRTCSRPRLADTPETRHPLAGR